MKMSITIKQHWLMQMNQIASVNSVFISFFYKERHPIADGSTSYFLLISANQTNDGFSAHPYFNPFQH